MTEFKQWGGFFHFEKFTRGLIFIHWKKSNRELIR